MTDAKTGSRKRMLLTTARDVLADMVALRRDLHANPELGGKEQRTAGIVASRLRALGASVRDGIAGTGVVGVISGARPGPCIAVRADMDALPIEDRKDVEYRSRVPGVMHACGHDGHVAMLLGVAKILKALSGEFSGSVKLIFQPAEEGPGGAEPMIKGGVLSDPDVSAVVSTHIWPDLPTGVVAVRSGPVMAAVDGIDITIRGEGGHGAAPHRSVDAIVVAAQAIMALQTIASRQVNPVDPMVLTIGTISGGYRHNVIADEVRMSGTLRTLNPALRKTVPGIIDRTLAGVTQSAGGTYEFTRTPGYPALINDETVASVIAESAKRLLGKRHVIEEIEPSMGGEDFAYFLQEVPGAMFMLGAGNPSKGAKYPAHHPRFDFDEDAMANGVALMVDVVLELLQRGT
ncbi:MAG: amidohydrolase [Bacillota bacterium]